MAAIHHALIAQQFTETYREWSGVENTDTTGWSQEQRLDFVPRQLAAKKYLPIIRANLFPEDDVV